MKPSRLPGSGDKPIRPEPAYGVIMHAASRGETPGVSGRVPLRRQDPGNATDRRTKGPNEEGRCVGKLVFRVVGKGTRREKNAKGETPGKPSAPQQSVR